MKHKFKCAIETCRNLTYWKYCHDHAGEFMPGTPKNMCAECKAPVGRGFQFCADCAREANR